MICVEAASANELFTRACSAVLEHGRAVKPRGMATTEVIGAHLTLTQPRRRMVHLPPARVLNAAFAAAEAVWILSGSDAPWIYTYNQRMAQYTDAGVLLGAYGPRMRAWRKGLDEVDQIDHVRRTLLADPDSRRALVQLYNPARDIPGHSDVPCTLGYRFYLRDGRLEMHTTMRSQDLWLGFCYDIFTATILHELMAHWIGAELGEYHHHADSLHLYQQNIADALALLSAPQPSRAMEPLGVPWETFDALMEQIVAGGTPPSAWGAFAEVMRSYRVWKGGDRADARQMVASATDVLGSGLSNWYAVLDGRTAR
ncbi:thymidylate synthase [Streptacidiphilus pinicola]|uniref:Thymidylate synthase n=1 Tax=Streptacidiphilus pinicola TaxID=2219663 RepID=A0A2X0ISK2_9ACTN|nr:thymidylate synthase [Streptacidiphilus pinicola]RAG86231.1 thymidylate synthase [Streptacidiphilus pinicola]